MRVEIADQQFVLTISSDTDASKVVFRLPYADKSVIVYLDESLPIHTYTLFFTDPVVRKWFIPLSNWYADRLALPIRASILKSNDDSFLKSEFMRLEVLVAISHEKPFDASAWINVLVDAIQSAKTITVATEDEDNEFIIEDEVEESWEGTSEDFEENPEWLQEMIKGSDDTD